MLKQRSVQESAKGGIQIDFKREYIPIYDATEANPLKLSASVYLQLHPKKQ